VPTSSQIFCPGCLAGARMRLRISLCAHQREGDMTISFPNTRDAGSRCTGSPGRPAKNRPARYFRRLAKCGIRDQSWASTRPRLDVRTCRPTRRGHSVHEHACIRPGAFRPCCRSQRESAVQFPLDEFVEAPFFAEKRGVKEILAVVQVTNWIAPI
jgi:hypothetical protein